MSESTAQGAAVPRAGTTRLLSDSRLTRRATAGDQRAFAAIFRRYQQDLYRYCVAILGNSQDAQDALQNTMVKILAALPGEKREIQLKPWLYRIAHNEAVDLRRAQQPVETLDTDVPVIGAEPGEVAELRARMRGLISDIEELPERQRGALVMRELSGLSFEQIGAAFGTSPAVARQTVYEARLSLQRMSEGREMDCAAVTKTLSDGDGRLSRRRELRAHLRSCAACRRFEEDLGQRQRDFAVIAPLPAVVATGLLHGIVGGGSSSASGGLLAGLGAATGKTVAGSVVVKSAATVAVVAAVGATAADRGGLVDLGLPGNGSDRGSSTRQAAPGPGEAGQGSGSQPAAATKAAKAPQLQGAKPMQAGNAAKGGNQRGAGKQVSGKGAPPDRPSHRGRSKEDKAPPPRSGNGQGNAKAHGANPGSRSQGTGAGANAQGKGASSQGNGAAANSQDAAPQAPQQTPNANAAAHEKANFSPPTKPRPSGGKKSSGARSQAKSAQSGRPKPPSRRTAPRRTSRTEKGHAAN
jgi:RNA polymerase sigma factor (sigma-70 family)